MLPIALETAKNYKLTTRHVRIDWFSGTGKGGQKRNKTQSSCRLHHIPTGIIITRQGRSRQQNYESAWGELVERLAKADEIDNNSTISSTRNNQIGSGMRADKIRTYRFQNNSIKDHQSGITKKANYVMRGNFNSLWQNYNTQ